MKKIIALTLCVAAIGTSLFSCGKGKAPVEESTFSQSTESVESESSSVHVHQFGGWVVLEDATCQKKGKERRWCPCGTPEEREFYAEHVYGDDGRCIWCEKLDESLVGIKSDITLTNFDGAEVDIVHPTLRAYMDNRNDPKKQATTLKEEEGNPQALIKQNITFSWTTDGIAAAPYTVAFADNEKFENAYEEKIQQTYCDSVGFFTPGVTYYWRVTSANGVRSAVDTFKIKDAPTRLITAGSLWNVRDFGGWSVGTGKRVAYGKLYRGDDPNTLEASSDGHANAASIKVLRYLGINGEIDVRLNSKNERHFLDESKPFLKAGLKYFSQNIPNTTVGTWAESNGDFPIPLSTISQNVGKIFKFLANENNYPVYLHCTFGKDRTGSISYIIGALLGMSYEDLMCDYEMSSFVSEVKTQPRNTIISDGAGGWQFRDAKDDPWGEAGRMHYDFAQNYPAATQAESIAKYLTQDCGVTQAEIAKIREILIEQVK